jgi:hypothetical protein
MKQEHECDASNPLTIGGLIDILASVPEDAVVTYAPLHGLVPTYVDSWRGIYAEPALGWKLVGWDEPEVTAGALLATLRGALEDEFTGYKGGTYRYQRQDTLHIDNYGEWTQTEVRRIEVREGWNGGRWSVVLDIHHEDRC